jgi:glycerate kinase
MIPTRRSPRARIKTLALRAARTPRTGGGAGVPAVTPNRGRPLPGAAGPPRTETAARVLTGAGGVVTFVPRATQQAESLVGRFRWIRLPGLGGVESSSRCRPDPPPRDGACRAARARDAGRDDPPALGIAAPEDLIADWDQRSAASSGSASRPAPNAFKGSFDAVAVARAWEVAARAREGTGARPEVRIFPMADGGDGFLAALRHYRPAVLEVSARARDPLGRAVAAVWGWDPDADVAYVESASAIWLRLLERGERDPLRATSAGLGRLIRTAAGLAPKEIVVGLGGSATVDGGLDGAGRSIPLRGPCRSPGRGATRPPGLVRHRPAPLPPGRDPRPRARRRGRAAHGPGGAARAFAPEGSRPAAVERLAEGLERLAEAWVADPGTPRTRRRGRAPARRRLAAAGRVPGARRPGAAWLADLASLAEAIAGGRSLPGAVRRPEPPWEGHRPRSPRARLESGPRSSEVCD